MLRSILKLYDNFLGRFKFFRMFIDVLIDIDERQNEQERSLAELTAMISELHTAFEELKDKHQTIPSDVSQKNAHTIIAKYRDALLNDNE